jgi:hypothetical protein
MRVYRYLLSFLHQLNILSERTRVGTWAISMFETSRKVVEGCSSTITGIFQNLVTHNAVHLLQETM